MIVASQWSVLALVRAPYSLPVQRLVPWSLTGNSQSNAPHLILVTCYDVQAFWRQTRTVLLCRSGLLRHANTRRICR